METVETLVKKYKKMGTAQVISQMGRVKGNAKLACLEVLKSRNQDVSQWEEEGLVEEKKVKFQELKKEFIESKKTVYEAEPEEELTKEERKAIIEAEKEFERERKEDDIAIKLRAEKQNKPLQKVVKEKIKVVKSKGSSKSNIQYLDESQDKPGIKVNSLVITKDGMTGSVENIYICPKVNKEYLKINVDGKFVYRRSVTVNI